MYRLLIVTDDPKATDMLTAMNGWESMGFKRPKLITTAGGAEEVLSQRRVDAIAVQNAPAFASLFSYLDETQPDLPMFDIAGDEQAQRDVLQQLYRLLVRVNADDSNDEYDEATRRQQIREKWMKKLIGGMVSTEAQIEREARLYRCRERMDVPCVLARLQLPEDDSFLSERWHYGSERLETALRNFFGFEHAGVRMYVAVVSQSEVRVLCYPLGEKAIDQPSVASYVHETLEQVDHYLGLHMEVLELCPLPGLKAFAQTNS